ncbi:methyl-accepting chemotaxis protein [Allohahella sp. A8]|uniref:methyl-accepting chemotaxis protein n=1 Tax=Allohahella sp. A8 TaxID=3141461 RepID=UPI003A80DAF7
MNIRMPSLKMPGQSLSRLMIGQRLMTLIGVMTGALLVTAILAFVALNLARDSSQNLHGKVTETTQLTQLISGLQKNFVATLNNLNSGVMTWSEAQTRVTDARTSFAQQWQQLGAEEGVINTDRTESLGQMVATSTGVREAFDVFKQLDANQSRAALELFILNDLNSLIDPFLTAATSYSARLNAQSEEAFAQSESTLSNVLYAGSIIILLSLMGALTLGTMIRRSIVGPITTIADTVSRVQQDDYTARTELKGGDELAQLGLALDQLLDDKVATLVRIEKENDALNDSVIELLEGSASLSERNFTTRLQVREDITGPVADALNLVTKETAEALVKVRQIGDLVEASSVLVDEQTSKVTNVAAQERLLVVQAIKKLEAASQQMNQIAEWGQACNVIAQNASGSTDKAQEAVSTTIESMDEIRDAISETEKRIKRLSERSQEISGIIDIINSIAERTHVLALNASMQAAAAGDAGRGFAVVADEVQRLAESSRSSTSQISALVRSIQSETADAVSNMNGSITQVVNGSRRAAQAGTQMQETQQTTRELVAAVQRIAESSILQAQEAEALRVQADKIEKSTRVTGQELKRQSVHTQHLRAASGVLQQTVGLFQLPDLGIMDLGLSLAEAAPVTRLEAPRGSTMEELAPRNERKIG